MQKLELTIGEQKEVTILEGKAPNPLVLEKRENAGRTIEAVAEFATNRYEQLKADLTAIIQYSIEDAKLSLTTNYGTDIERKLEGELKAHPYLQGFKINSDSMWEPLALAKHLRKVKHLFKDISAFTKTVEMLGSVKATIQTEISKTKDTRGNFTNNTERKLITDFEQSFTLELPLFIGFPAQSFVVDLCIDATDGGVQVWLESSQLNSLRDGVVNDKIQAEIVKIKALSLNIPIIQY